MKKAFSAMRTSSPARAISDAIDAATDSVARNAATAVTLRTTGLDDPTLADMSPEATRTQLGSALSVVIHLRRHHGHRYVESIGVLTRDGGDLRVCPALTQPAPEPGRPGPSTLAQCVAEPGWSRLAALLDAGSRG